MLLLLVEVEVAMNQVTLATAVTGKAGCLLIVKNYTGDRLNFGIAAEMARASGLVVQMVYVGDDVTGLIDAPCSASRHTRRRGIAGTLIMHKVLGALADQGHQLDKIIAMANDIMSSLNSMGVGLSSCTIPAIGRPTFDLGDDEIEIGLGIHGEPDLDSKVGDGDLGLTLERASNSVLKMLDSIQFDTPCYALRVLSRTLQETLGGSTGPFYSIFMLRTSNVLYERTVANGLTEPTVCEWADALDQGAKAISDLGGAKLGDCTMLDSLLPCVEAIVNASHSQDTSIVDISTKAAQAAHDGATSTIDLVAKMGRSSYIGDRSQGTMDPGACAISVIAQSIKSTVHKF
eukprot:gene12854-15096_t